LSFDIDRSFLTFCFQMAGPPPSALQGGPGLCDAPFDDGEVASIGGDGSGGDAQPFRPQAGRDMTVPCGMFNIAAVSA
jgi:hypothetical protein